jgi:hypothetical protein
MEECEKGSIPSIATPVDESAGGPGILPTWRESIACITE